MDLRDLLAFAVYMTAEEQSMNDEEAEAMLRQWRTDYVHAEHDTKHMYCQRCASDAQYRIADTLIRIAKRAPVEKSPRLAIRLWFRLKGIWTSIRSAWRSPWWRKCDRECAWVAPCGFVPEADCPVHDPPPTSAYADSPRKPLPIDYSEEERTDDLLPCPFCGGDRAKVVTVEWIGRSRVACMNGRCCCEGPMAEYEHQARVLWNGRHEIEDPAPERQSVTLDLDSLKALIREAVNEMSPEARFQKLRELRTW